MSWEQWGAMLLTTGIVCFLGASLWIWIVSWRVSWKWGLGLLLFAPLGVVFLARHFARVKLPGTLLLVSLLLIAIPFGVNAIVQRVDLGPREKLVDGELHITLTGWDQKDYSILQQKPQVVVLQMANENVTDATLEYIRNARNLKEIDLNDTQITDAGLALLKEFPRLATLRMRGTKVTNEGFLKELGDKDTLMDLDARETEIVSKTLRQWKNAKEGRKYLK